jgi:hypothetical protein
MRAHRAKVAAEVDALVRATGGDGDADAPRTRRVRDRVKKLDALAAAASGMAKSSTHRARQATALALGVAAALGAGAVGACADADFIPGTSTTRDMRCRDWVALCALRRPLAECEADARKLGCEVKP